MPDATIWLHIGSVILLFAGFCCFVAAFAAPIRMMISAFLAILYRPIASIQENTSSYIRSVGSWINRQVEDESDRKGEGPIYYIIGSVLYSILTVLFIACDFGMIVLTAEAMGLDASSVELPIDTSTLTAATLVTTSLFFGAIFFDLIGVTRLAPWRKSLSVGFRRTFMVLSVVCFLISLVIGVSMAYWRGYMTVEFVPEAEASEIDAGMLSLGGLSVAEGSGLSVIDDNPALTAGEDLLPMDTSKNWIVYASLMGISALSISATAFSIVGLVILVKFLIVLLVGLCVLPLLPVTFATWFVSLLLDLVFGAIERVIDFFVQIGTSILRIFGWQPAEAQNQMNQGDITSDNLESDADGSQAADESGQPDPGFNPFPAR